MNLKEKIEQGYVLSRIIIEVMGSPKDYVEKTLRLAVDNIKQKQKEISERPGQKDIEILKEEFFPAEEKEKMFSSFAELEILFRNTFELVNFCFEYTPSSIEILEPGNLNYKSRDFSNALNDLLGKIHNNAMVIKNYAAENTLLKKNASTLLQNIAVLSLKERDKNLNELSKDIGISEEKLKNILEDFMENNIILKKGDKYAKKKN